jgi:hypothetical protein
MYVQTEFLNPSDASDLRTCSTGRSHVAASTTIDTIAPGNRAHPGAKGGLMKPPMNVRLAVATSVLAGAVMAIL